MRATMTSSYVIRLTVVLSLAGQAYGDVTRELNGYRYMAITSSRRNWDQAEARCVSYGGHLARITSSTQQHLLTDMALGHSGTHYWIGCTDRQIEGIWRWSDGSSLSYTNWAPTQPDNADGIQDCGILYSIYGYAQWDDTECSTPYFFICQTDINECSNDNGGCSHNCENTDGSYRCTCQDGYQLSGLTDCRDINECSNDNGGCSHNCENTDGSYRCTCQDGYQLSGSTDCRDINECSNDNGGCSHNCENTDGSYRCICQDGYQLSGLTDCRDEDDKTPGTLENILSSVVPPITTIVVVILIVIAIIFAISKYKNKTTPDNSNSQPPPYTQMMAWK
ncbi:uncharacterized protein LOC144859503 [Branchiostoma floridae x Branchiostoma japonicum]